MRLIQKHACSTDLVLIHRVSCGLPPLPQYAYELSRWNESPHLNPAEVEKALTDLWSYVSLAEKAADAILGNEPLPPSTANFYRHQPSGGA